MSQQALNRVERPAIENTDAMQRFAWNFTDTVVVARRNLLHYVRLPQLLVFSFIQPIMFVLLFAYVFGGAIQTPNGDYINYLLPGILVQTVLFGGIQTTIGLSDDLRKGLIDRFRSLPMARSAVLAGRTLADSFRNLLMIIVMIFVGYIIGFRFQDGVVSALGAIGLLLIFGHVMSWVFACIGILVKDPETAQAAGFLWVFPLVFASSIFVPVDTMPSALQTFAENQPISLLANTVRALVLGSPTDDLWKVMAWMIGIFAVFVPTAIALYRRTTN